MDSTALDKYFADFYSFVLHNRHSDWVLFFFFFCNYLRIHAYLYIHANVAVGYILRCCLAETGKKQEVSENRAFKVLCSPAELFKVLWSPAELAPDLCCLGRRSSCESALGLSEFFTHSCNDSNTKSEQLSIPGPYLRHSLYATVWWQTFCMCLPWAG